MVYSLLAYLCGMRYIEVIDDLLTSTYKRA